MKTTLLTEVTVGESLLKGYPLGLLYFVKTAAAEAKGVSNCPLCAIGHAANAREKYSNA